jgi:hypothetical protein
MGNIFKNPLFKMAKKLLLSLLVLMSPLLLCIGFLLIFGVSRPLPPGYTDMFPSRDWSLEVIEELIDRPFPPSAQNIYFDGRIGVLGSYGITPSLKFSFLASPDDATAFAHSFCNGVLHQGYDPFIALDSEYPSSGDILIAGDPFLYYSSSPNADSDIAGNRCVRLDWRNPYRSGAPRRWFEEIALELSEPLATVRYRLPYKANAYDPTAYPVAYHINPLDDQFSLYVSGIVEIERYEFSLSQMGTIFNDLEASGVSFAQTYPTLCFRSRGWDNMQYDRFYWSPQLLVPYQQAKIGISIDDTLLFTTTLTEEGVMFDPTYQEFCFDTTWGAGNHNARLDVQRTDGIAESFEWQFYTPETILEGI